MERTYNQGEDNQGEDNQGQNHQGQGKVNGEIWAADGPIYTPSCAYPGNPAGTAGTLKTPSSVKVLDLKTGKNKAVISTGGNARADELCYNPTSNVVLVANPSELSGTPPTATGGGHHLYRCKEVQSNRAD